MRNQVKFGIFALAAAVSFVGASAGMAKEITIAADPWCPFNCDPGTEKPGYMVEIAKEVFEPLGYTVVYQTVNWSRALESTREGQFNAVFGASRDEAEGFIFPEQSQGGAGNAFFVNGSTAWSLNSHADLKGKKLGLIRDYDYGEVLGIVGDEADIDYSSGDDALEKNVKKLAASRVDVVVEEANVFNYTAAELGLLGDVKLAMADDADEVFIAFSPAKEESAQLAKDLDMGLTKLRESGRLAEILSRYGLSDWQ